MALVDRGIEDPDQVLSQPPRALRALLRRTEKDGLDLHGLDVLQRLLPDRVERVMAKAPVVRLRLFRRAVLVDLRIPVGQEPREAHGRPDDLRATRRDRAAPRVSTLADEVLLAGRGLSRLRRRDDVSGAQGKIAPPTRDRDPLEPSLRPREGDGQDEPVIVVVAAGHGHAPHEGERQRLGVGGPPWHLSGAIEDHGRGAPGQSVQPHEDAPRKCPTPISRGHGLRFEIILEKQTRTGTCKSSIPERRTYMKTGSNTFCGLETEQSFPGGPDEDV